MPPHTLSHRVAELVVRDHFTSCATRDRGRRFYALLAEYARNVPGRDDVVIAFDGVDFVSPSFLDETVVRLVEEQPVLAERLLVTGLHPIAAEKLRAALERHHIRGVRIDA